MPVTQQERDELRQEMLEDSYRDECYEQKMYEDLDFAIDKLDLLDAMSEVEELVKRLNNYGHEISVSEIVRDYYWKDTKNELTYKYRKSKIWTQACLL